MMEPFVAHRVPKAFSHRARGADRRLQARPRGREWSAAVPLPAAPQRNYPLLKKHAKYSKAAEVAL